MLCPAPPVSNVERQRQFRERNPGYFRKYHARQRAIAKAAKERIRAMAMADAQAAAAAEAASAAAAVPATRPPLLLPAPAEPLVLPGLSATRATPAPLPVIRPVRLAA